MKEVLKRIYFWQGVVAKTQGVKRGYEDDIAATLFSKPVKIITGFRRSGKSFLIRQVARRYIEEKQYSLTNILYLNFEDYALAEINTAKKLADVFELFNTEIADLSAKRLLIFDEIQNVKDWDRFIRTIYESESNIEIIITGSNSELLSSEIGSNLAGRFIEFFVLPFSFREFLTYRNALPESKADFLRQNREIKSLFSEYVSFGGLPEVFEINSVDAKKSYLSGVLHKVILDDIVKRFHMDNIDVLEKMLAYILSSSGYIISYAKIEHLIKSYGIKIAPETVIKYVSYFIKTFSIFELTKFDWKLRKHFPTTRKYYVVDSGLITLYRFEDENYAYCIENVVFLELLRQKHAISFGLNSSNKEIDFIVQNKSSIVQTKVQVALNLNEQSLKREIKSFTTADRYINNGDNLLLTLEESRLRQYQDTTVLQKNIPEWLLFG